MIKNAFHTESIELADFPIAGIVKYASGDEDIELEDTHDTFLAILVEVDESLELEDIEGTFLVVNITHVESMHVLESLKVVGPPQMAPSLACTGWQMQTLTGMRHTLAQVLGQT